MTLPSDFQTALDEIKAMERPTCCKVQWVIEALLDERPERPDDDDSGWEWEADFLDLLTEIWCLSTCKDIELMTMFVEDPDSGYAVFATPTGVLEYNDSRFVTAPPFAYLPWREIYPGHLKAANSA